MFGGASTWGQQNSQQQQQQQQQQPQQGGLFGQPAAAPTQGGFGSTGGFGASPSGFGQQQQPPAQGGGLFGGGAAQPASTFGGFGASAQQPRPGFGASSTPSFGGFGGGASAPASTFGGAPAPAAGGGLFGGGGGAATSGFGAPAAGGGGFGQPAGQAGGFGGAGAGKMTLFGQPQGVNAGPGDVPPNGSQQPAWTATQDQDPNTGVKNNDYYQTITAMPEYRGASLEELRVRDYEQDRKGPQAQPASTGFGGAPGGFGGFGAQPAAPAAPASGGLFGGAGGGAFGAPKPAGGGLFGSQSAQTPAFGAPAAGAGGGLFGGGGGGGFGQPAQQQPASTGFGAQPAKPAFGGFGAPAATPAPAFGAPAAQPSTGFGGFGQPQQQQQQPAQQQSTFGGFGQQQQQQQQQQPAAPASGGLFGSQPAGGGLFGAQPPKPAGTGLFGAPAQQPAQSGGLFGGGSTGGGLFGNTQQQQQPASGGLFGNTQQNQQQQQPASTGGLFGNTGSTPQSGGLFGGSQPAGQQQQQPAQGGGLFGGGAAGGGLFGQKPATPAPTGGLFGSAPAQPPQGGGLFGAPSSTPQTGGLFGSQPQNNTGGSSLFGAKPATGGLFGGGGGGLGGSTPGGGGLFGSSLGGQSGGLQLGGQQQQQQMQQQMQQSQQQQPQQSLQASVDQNPYGRNPLFDQTTSVWPIAQDTPEKKTPLASLAARSRALTGSKNLPRLRGFNQSPSMSSPGRSASPGLADPSSPGSFVARQSVKKLVLNHKVDGSDVLNASRGSNGGFGASNGYAPSPAKQAAPDVVLKKPVPVAAPAAAPAPAAAAASPAPPKAPKAPLQHGDYYTKPDIDELVRFGYQDLTALPNFIVGRKGFGEVAFLAPVDLTSVPAIRDIPGGIVLFAEKMCEVYPDNVPKAPRGTGLNVPARITLHKCWPVDKASREPIKDIGNPRMKQHLRILKGMAETEFVSYEAEPGTWVFKVQHFSRYGLLGSDDEDDDEADAGAEAQQDAAAAQPSPAAAAAAAGSNKRASLSPSDVAASNADLSSDEDASASGSDGGSPSMSVDSYSSSGPSEIDDDDDEPTSVDARPPPWGAATGVEPRKVQVMQASFFGSGEGRAADVSPRPSRFAAAGAPAKRHSPFQHSTSTSDPQHLLAQIAPAGAFQQPSFGFDHNSFQAFGRRFAQPDPRDVPPHPSLSSFEVTKLQLNKSFRAGFGPGGVLVHFGRSGSGSETSGSSSRSKLVIEQIPTLSRDQATESEKAARVLKVQLEHSDISFEDGVPVARPSDALRFHHLSSTFGADDQSFEAQLLRLGSALFDEIDLRLPADAPAQLSNRILLLRRKMAVSKWLQSAVSGAVDQDLLSSQENGPSRVFALLTGHQVERASQTALDAGDVRLATLIARIGGNQAFRDEVALQLAKWKAHRIDSDIAPDYRKIYSLLAGLVGTSDGSSSADRVDVAPEVFIPERLDWKRAFGLHLWYGSAFDADLADSLQRYQDALASTHAPALPVSWYQEASLSTNDARRWDTPPRTLDALYLLLNLYADTATSLERVLDPSTFGPTPLDFRLSWHLYAVLALVLQSRDFADREALPTANELGFSAAANALTSSYAAQLEELGLWDQAVLVLLHLELPESRKKAIQEVLFRNVGSSAEKEAFVVETLLVPKEWLSAAKANIANYEGDPYGRYFHLVDAKLYDQACAVCTRELVPEALLREDFELAAELLAPLKTVAVSDWATTGQVILDLVRIITRLPVLLADAVTGSLDAAQTDEISDLSSKLPALVHLLPPLLENGSLQGDVVCSEMLNRLLKLGGSLRVSKWLDAPPPIPHGNHLLESAELALVQAAALDSFALSLEAFA